MSQRSANGYLTLGKLLMGWGGEIGENKRQKNLIEQQRDFDITRLAEQRNYDEGVRKANDAREDQRTVDSLILSGKAIKTPDAAKMNALPGSLGGVGRMLAQSDVTIGGTGLTRMPEELPKPQEIGLGTGDWNEYLKRKQQVASIERQGQRAPEIGLGTGDFNEYLKRLAAVNEAKADEQTGPNSDFGRKAQFFQKSARNAFDTIGQYYDKPPTWVDRSLGKIPIVGNALGGKDVQSLEQSATALADAYLRLTTGANYNAAEVEATAKQLIPQVGDLPETREQKRKQALLFMDAIEQAAQPRKKVLGQHPTQAIPNESLSDADYWEQLVQSGMSKDQATAAVHKRKK